MDAHSGEVDAEPRLHEGTCRRVEFAATAGDHAGRRFGDGGDAAGRPLYRCGLAHHLIGHRVRLSLERVTGLAQSDASLPAGCTRAAAAAGLAEQKRCFVRPAATPKEQWKFFAAGRYAAMAPTSPIFGRPDLNAFRGPVLLRLHIGPLPLRYTSVANQA